MKKVFLFSVLIVSLIVLSCKTNQDSVSVDSYETRIVQPEFFYVVKDTVKSGHNTWDRAKVFYNDGFQWRHIVAENEFLQEPGRVWKDETTGVWYCLILPGEVLNIGEAQVNPVFKDTVVSKPVLPVEESTTDLSWLSWVFLISGLLLFAYFLYEMRFRNIDPVTAGKPQVEGGVNDTEAHNRMTEIAENRFPGSRLDVKNIRRGTLSGKAIVFYQGEEKPKRINLRKVPAYAGEIMVNGTEQTIYFLQGCGNDARRGDYFTGTGLTFVPEVLINQDGTESPIPSGNIPETEIKEPVVKVEKEKSDSVIAASSSDEVMISNDHATVADEFLKTQRAHRVTMEYTKGVDGSVVIKSVFETKNELVKDTEKTN